MNLEEVLKAQGLTDEQISGILKTMKDNKIFTASEENIDERYQKLKGQKDDIDGQLKTANDTIEDFKKNNKDNKTLQDTIKAHEDTISTLETSSKKKEFDMVIELELVKAKAKNTKALKAVLDLDKVKIKEDNTIEGLTDQIDSLKKSDSYLFETGKVETKYDPNGGSGTGGGDLASLMKSKDFNLTKHLKEQNKQ